MEEEISIFPERTIVYATFGQRFAAGFIDLLVLVIPDYFVFGTVGGRNFYIELLHGEYYYSSILGQILCTIIYWLYQALMESGRQQATIGQQALGIKVTGLYGGRISFLQATGRHFGEYLSVLILCIGYFMMLWDDQRQMLHDKMAGTLVVKKIQAI
jgi:uncharacterized RDD family membrane protein YckC